MKQRAAMIRPRGKSEAPHMIAAYRAMQMALEALEANMQDERVGQWRQMDDACTALREALAQPQDHSEQHLNMVQGKWVDLTDDEIEEVCVGLWAGYWSYSRWIPLAQTFITKFKSKNTPPSVEALLQELADSEQDVQRLLDLVGKLEDELEAAIEATKEKAAKVCEGIYPTWDGSCIEERYAIHAVKECAAAIRSMK